MCTRCAATPSPYTPLPSAPTAGVKMRAACCVRARVYVCLGVHVFVCAVSACIHVCVCMCVSPAIKMQWWKEGHKYFRSPLLCRYLATGSFDKHIHVWSVSDGSLVRSCRGEAGIYDVSWNEAGDKVAACFANRTVCVVDMRL